MSGTGRPTTTVRGLRPNTEACRLDFVSTSLKKSAPSGIRVQGYQSDRDHYRGKHFRPDKEWKQERKEEQKEMKQERKEEKRK